MRGEPAEACFEFRALRKDGSIIWLSSLANRVDYDGQPAVQGMFLDVNESKKAAEILYESEQRYRELANCLPDIVFETDLKGQLEFVNERASEISGYSLEEIERGVNIFQFIVPEDRDRATKTIQRLLSGGSYVPAEYKFMRKDGTTFPALITATPRISGNKMTGLRGLAIDITERKKAETLMKEAADDWVRIFNATDDLSFVMDKENRIVKVNKRTCDFLNKKPEELIGKHCYEVMHGTDKPWVNCPCKVAQKTGQPASSEVDDTHIGTPLLVSVSPVSNEKGELVEFVHIARSPQEQKSRGTDQK